MAKIFSEAAMKEIIEFIRKERSDRRNKPIRHEADEPDPQTPEVYIAKPQSASGIPALTTTLGVDSPGTDTCDIYKINSDGELIAVNFDKIVYNLSEAPIVEDWVLVKRTKYGKWIACHVFKSWEWGVLDGTLSQGSSATVSLWRGTTLADSGKDVTAHDNLLGSGQTLETGTKVKVEFLANAGKWYVTAAECN